LFQRRLQMLEVHLAESRDAAVGACPFGQQRVLYFAFSHRGLRRWRVPALGSVRFAVRVVGTSEDRATRRDQNHPYYSVHPVDPFTWRARPAPLLARFYAIASA